MTNEASRPNVVLVVAHPDHASTTWAVARAIEEGIQADGSTTATTHDLTASGFDPVFRAADLAVSRHGADVPADVEREQRLLESADVVVVFFPVYWWSMPALLKGWFDRVFTRDWAYDESSDGAPSAIKELHVVAAAGLGADAFERHGYTTAMTTQMMHGIAEYSRIDESSIEFLHDTESSDPRVHEQLIARGYKIGAGMAQRAQSAFDRKLARA